MLSRARWPRVARLPAWWRSIPRRRKGWIVALVAALVLFGSTFAFLGGQWIHSGLPWPDAYNSALALDASGRPHVVWGTVDLMYGTFSGVGWSSEVVDVDISVDSISIGLDSFGHAHIAYGAWNRSEDHVTSDRNIKYATNAGGNWAVSYVAYGAFAPSIAVDSTARAHLAYVQQTPGYPFDRRASYRVLSGGVWSSVLWLPSGASEAGRITLDSRDYAYIPIHDVVPGYATNRLGTWQVIRLDSEIEPQSVPSLVVGSHEDLHMSYTAWSPSDQSRVLRYATNASGSWMFFTLDRLENTNSDLAVIAQSPSGRLQIMYNDFRAAPEASIPTLRHAIQQREGWSLSVVSSNAFLEDLSSFAIGPGDKAHVVYVQDARAVGRPASESSVVYATKGLDGSILATFLIENAIVFAVEMLVVALALKKALQGRRKRPRMVTRAKADP